jgi:hypothetical protein
MLGAFCEGWVFRNAGILPASGARSFFGAAIPDQIFVIARLF